MNSTFTSKSVGRCLTEYRRVNYDVLVARAKSYNLYSQFDANKSSPVKLTEPKCGYGQVLFAVLETGEEVELMSIIDSSD